MFVSLTGHCPTQNREVTVHAPLLDGEKCVGRIECDFASHSGGCPNLPCPIVKQCGYHH